MPYQGPDPADLANVFVLNAAFIAWLRARSPGEERAGGLPQEIHVQVRALGNDQRQRLARTPFLLMSLAENDDVRWRPLLTDQHTRDLLQSVQPRDEAATRLMAAGLAFLWQLARRNPYAVRLLSGASLSWCEQLAACTLMELFERVLEDQSLLAPRLADKAELWNKLLTAGVSPRRPLRRAARVAALQVVLTQQPALRYRPLRAAACKTPSATTRRSPPRIR